MENIYVLESGIKRKAEKHDCEYCGEEFLRRKNASKLKKYCSKKCRKLSKKTAITCSNCNKIIYKSLSKLKNSKHGFYFCNRQCKEEAQKIGGKCPEIRPPHYGTSRGRETYKNLITNTKNPSCEGCNECNVYLLQVHHKDGNRKNNVESNFEIVCGNCHIKRHLYLKDGIWSYWGKMLTPREILVTL